MPIDSSFNFDDMLSLDKARLVNRVRLNFLGSKELILEYNGVPNSGKEDAIEWLEANRLSVTNPKFGFRTYEGTWYCIDISYVDSNGNRPVIRQRFKVDSAITNEVSEKSAGVEVVRSYYFKVVDPEAYNIPDTISDGDVWDKRVQDNGDGTYDVVIAKTTAENLTGESKARSAGFTETTEVSTNSDELSFVSDGGTVPNPVAGETKTITNQPLENGKFRTTVTTRTDNNLSSTSNTQAEGFTEEVVVNTNDNEQAFVSDGGSIANATTGEIKTIQNQPLDNGKFRTSITTRTANNQESLNEVQSGDVSSFSSYPGSYYETEEISTATDEQRFVSSGGTVPDAVTGEIKKIDNIPLENGLYRSVVTTRTAVAQRIPPESAAGGPDYPWLEYGSDYIQDANNIIIGVNQPWEKFTEDRDRTQFAPAIFKINSISVRVNDYGLFDYTIVSNSPG